MRCRLASPELPGRPVLSKLFPRTSVDPRPLHRLGCSSALFCPENAFLIWHYPSRGSPRPASDQPTVLSSSVSFLAWPWGQGFPPSLGPGRGAEQVPRCCVQISARGSGKTCQHQAKLFMFQAATPVSNSNSNARASTSNTQCKQCTLSSAKCDRSHQAEMLQLVCVCAPARDHACVYACARTCACT